MSKFCVNCGKQLEEGQTCNCKVKNAALKEVSNAASQAASTVVVSQQKSRFLIFLEEMFKTFINYFKKPNTVTKSMIEKADIKTGIFFVGLQAVIALILFVSIVNKISDLFGSFGFAIDALVTNNVMVLTRVFLLVILQFFLLAGIIFCIGKTTFKSTGSFKSLVIALGLATIPTSSAMVLSAIIFSLLYKVAPFILVFGIILTFLLNFTGIEEALKVERDKSIYLTAISYIIFCITVVIFSLIVI